MKARAFSDKTQQVRLNWKPKVDLICWERGKNLPFLQKSVGAIIKDLKKETTETVY